MFRRVAPSVAAIASTRAAADAPKIEKRSKTQTLHKILTGEISFKNKALVKESNVELMFGKDWKNEFATYTATLPAAEQEVVKRQVARLSLTRYTIRELSEFAANGVANVDAAAQAWNVSQGLRIFSAKGEAEFTRLAKAEGALANWTEDAVAKYIASVKAAKK
jgi:hypothetical protein